MNNKIIIYTIKSLQILITLIKYKLFFGNIGLKSIILKPLRIDGSKNIYLYKSVFIGKYSWIASMNLTGNLPKLIFKDNATIGNFNHIYCTHYIEIQEGALTADKVYITDNLHKYEDINTWILKQGIKQLNKVIIGSGCWIGENVSVIGASIGKNSIIGSNSVVTKDIPDFCVAVGSPAYIIKRYNFKTKKWEKTDKKGNFI